MSAPYNELTIFLVFFALVAAGLIVLTDLAVMNFWPGGDG